MLPVWTVVQHDDGPDHLGLWLNAGRAADRRDHDRGHPGEPRPAAAIPMDSPYCSCKLTRVRVQGEGGIVPVCCGTRTTRNALAQHATHNTQRTRTMHNAHTERTQTTHSLVLALSLET